MALPLFQKGPREAGSPRRQTPTTPGLKSDGINSKKAKRGFFDFTLIAVALFLAVLVTASISLFHKTGSRILYETTPFDTDEADHANAALELFVSVSNGDLQAALQSLKRQAFYPPLHSLLLLPSYLSFGAETATSRLPSIFVTALGALLLFLVTFRALKTYRLAGACLGTALFLLSPVIIANSVLCMLEPLGVFLATCLLIALTKVDLVTQKQTDPLTKPLLLIAICLASVFLTKYSFGLALIPAVFLALLFNQAIELKKRIKALTHLGLFLSLILITWVLFTDRAVMWHFFVGHPNYAPLFSFKNLFFYPHAWIADYHPLLALGVLSTICALVGTFSSWDSFAVRTAFFTTLVSYLVLTASTVNEARHFVIAAPGLFFLAGVGFSVFLTKIDNYLKSPFWSAVNIQAICISLLVVLIANQFVIQDGKLKSIISKELEGIPSFGELQDFIVSNINPLEPLLVYGFTDQFSQEALRFRVGAKAGLAYTATKVDAFPFREVKFQTARGRNRNIDHPWLEPGFPKEPLEQVLTSGYYKAFVTITPPGKKGLSTTLSSNPNQTLSKKGWRVTIYDLP